MLQLKLHARLHVINKKIANMSRNKSLNNRELIDKLSDIDSDTPATANWLRTQLIKKQLPVPEDKRTVVEIKAWLVDHLQLPRGVYLDSVHNIVDKLIRYWRVNRSRVGLVSVSVHLKPEIAEKLTKMSKGTTKQSVISQLIEGNYIELIRENNAQQTKKREERNVLKIEKAKIHSKAFFDQKLAPNRPIKTEVPDELKAGVEKLYHYLFPEKCNASEQGDELPITDKSKES